LKEKQESEAKKELDAKEEKLKRVVKKKRS
jgi:hypothetical protein